MYQRAFMDNNNNVDPESHSEYKDNEHNKERKQQIY